MRVSLSLMVSMTLGGAFYAKVKGVAPKIFPPLPPHLIYPGHAAGGNNLNRGADIIIEIRCPEGAENVWTSCLENSLVFHQITCSCLFSIKMENIVKNSALG